MITNSQRDKQNITSLRKSKSFDKPLMGLETLSLLKDIKHIISFDLTYNGTKIISFQFYSISSKRSLIYVGSNFPRQEFSFDNKPVEFTCVENLSNDKQVLKDIMEDIKISFNVKSGETVALFPRNKLSFFTGFNNFFDSKNIEELNLDYSKKLTSKLFVKVQSGNNQFYIFNLSYFSKYSVFAGDIVRDNANLTEFKNQISKSPEADAKNILRHNPKNFVDYAISNTVAAANLGKDILRICNILESKMLAELAHNFTKTVTCERLLNIVIINNKARTIARDFIIRNIVTNHNLCQLLYHWSKNRTDGKKISVNRLLSFFKASKSVLRIKPDLDPLKSGFNLFIFNLELTLDCYLPLIMEKSRDAATGRFKYVIKDELNNPPKFGSLAYKNKMTELREILQI